MAANIKPDKIEQYETLYQGKSIYSRFSKKTYENTFVIADEGTFYFKEINLEDLFKTNILNNVSVLYFKNWSDYNQFRNENTKMKIVAYSEQHTELRLIIQN